MKTVSDVSGESPNKSFLFSQLAVDMACNEYGWFWRFAGLEIGAELEVHSTRTSVAVTGLTPPPADENSLSGSPSLALFTPRSELGRQLWALRQRIVSYEKRLLDWEEVQEELAQRRGER